MVGGTFNGKKKVISDACAKSDFSFTKPEQLGFASSVVILSDEEKDKENAIYKIKYLRVLTSNELVDLIGEQTPNVFCFSSEINVDNNINKHSFSDDIKIIDIANTFGYLSEATLSFQISLCTSLKSVVNASRHDKIIIACQLFDGNYATYELVQCK